MTGSMFMQGKASAILGEAIVRLVDNGRVYGFSHPPVNEIYEYIAKKGIFAPAFSIKEMADIGLGISTAGKRTFVITSGTGIYDCMEAISYATSYEVPFLSIHIGKSIPGFGNPYPYQGDLEILKAGDFPPIIFCPYMVDEIPFLLSQMVELSERYRHPAVFYLDSALLNMTGGADLNLKAPEASWGLRTEKRVISSIYLEVRDMEKRLSGLKEKYNLIRKEARSHLYMMEDAEYVVVAYGICAYIAKKAVDELRLMDIKAGMINPVILSPLPDLNGQFVRAKKIYVVEMSNGQLYRYIKGYVGGVEMKTYNAYGGLIPDKGGLIDYIKGSL